MRRVRREEESGSERLAKCRVYTPPALASAIVRALGDEQSATWLEPCVGRGAFVNSLSQLGVPRQRILSIDLDKTPHATDDLSKTLRGTEFLSWAQDTDRRFERIVGNPPFLALSSAPKTVRDAALRLRTPDGSPVTRGANLWYAFLCGCLRVLTPGGSIALVLPAAWEYADYAAPLRDSLARLFEKVVVHRSKVPLFAEVSDGSVVLFAWRFLRRAAVFRRVVHSTSDQLIADLGSVTNALSNPRPLEGSGPAIERVGYSSQFTELRNVLRLRLGGVTGDVGYFLMTEDERRSRKLPVSAMQRVVTRAGQLSSSVLRAQDWTRLKLAGERVWLFRPLRRSTENSAVRRYLYLKPEKGGCNRAAHKISTRTPWHRTPLPQSIHGFVSGMTSTGPWLCLSEAPRVNATNTLYVVTFNRTIIKEMRPAWALAMLTSCARASIRARARRYADGLMKFEPGDLLGATVPVPERMEGASEAYERAVSVLLAGREQEACKIADNWLRSSR